MVIAYDHDSVNCDQLQHIIHTGRDKYILLTSDVCALWKDFCLLQVVMDVTDLLLTAITVTLGITLVLCCYFHKCAPSRYVHMQPFQVLFDSSRSQQYLAASLYLLTVYVRNPEHFIS